MVSKYIRIACVLSFILSFGHVKGQTEISITNPNLEFKNNRLFISYTIQDKSSQYYTVNIEIINSNGQAIPAKSFEGDIGKKIKAGKSKTIVWNLANDNVRLNESISVRIIGEKESKPDKIVESKQFNKSILVLQSAAWPGWGQTKINNGKPYWVIGCASVACLAGSYIYNQKASESYDQYVMALTPGSSEKYYDQAMQQDNTSKILGYSALGIWAANIIWMALTPNESKSLYSDSRFKVGLNSAAMTGNNHVSVSLVINLNPK